MLYTTAHASEHRAHFVKRIEHCVLNALKQLSEIVDRAMKVCHDLVVILMKRLNLRLERQSRVLIRALAGRYGLLHPIDGSTNASRQILAFGLDEVPRRI